MCLYPFGNAVPVLPDQHAWALIHIARAFVVVQLIAATLFACAFHWVDFATDLLIAIAGIFTLAYRTEYGFYLFSIVFFAAFNVALAFWAVIRILLFTTNTSTTAAQEHAKLAGWQQDCYMAAIIIDVIVFVALSVLSILLYRSLKALQPPPQPSEQGDAEGGGFFGGFGGGGGGGGGGRNGYAPVPSSEPSYLQPNVGGAARNQQSGQRYNFSQGQGYRLGD